MLWSAELIAFRSPANRSAGPPAPRCPNIASNDMPESRELAVVWEQEKRLETINNDKIIKINRYENG